MDRLNAIRDMVETAIAATGSADNIREAHIHLYSVSMFCAMLAIKRKENVELAAAAGMLHDIYSFTSPDTSSHAANGAIIARSMLTQLGLHSHDEIELICGAIHNHSDKKNIHTPLDEVLKDADVLSHCMYAPLDKPPKHDKNRYELLKAELNMA